MTTEDRALLEWTQRMINASRELNEYEQMSLEAWMAAGEKRSTWEGWESRIGPRPVPAKKAAPGKVKAIARKTA